MLQLWAHPCGKHAGSDLIQHQASMMPERETAVTKTPSTLWKNPQQPPKTFARRLPGLKDNILKSQMEDFGA